MRTLSVGLLVALAGCDDTVKKVGPGTSSEPNIDEGDDTGGPGPWACDNRTFDGSCVEFTGPEWDLLSATSGCDGEMVDGECPTPNLGRCVRELNLPLENVDVYYAGAFFQNDAADYLAADCELNGGQWRR